MPKAKVTTTNPKFTPSITHDRNHLAIRQAFMEILRTKKRAPTYAELARKTGYAYDTIKRHVKQLNFRASTDKFKILTEDVLTAVARSAIKGSVSSVRILNLSVDALKLSCLTWRLIVS